MSLPGCRLPVYTLGLCLILVTVTFFHGNLKFCSTGVKRSRRGTGKEAKFVHGSFVVRLY